MNIVTQAELVRQIDDFLLRHDMKPSRLARDATGEPGLIEAIREGKRSPTLATVEKLATFMRQHDEEARTRAKLAAGSFDAAAAHQPSPEEEQNQLPFVQAPVNRTGASLPTSSSTTELSTTPPANGSCPGSSTDQALGLATPVAERSTPTEPRVPTPSCSAETATVSQSLSADETRAEGQTPGAPPVFSGNPPLAGPATPTEPSPVRED